MKIDLYPLKLYFKRKPIIIAGTLGLILNLSAGLLLLFQVPHRQGDYFLHYTILFGVDRIGSYQEIFTVPLWGFTIFILNLVVGWVVYSYDAFMAEITQYVSVVVQALIFIAAILLVFLNV